MDRSSKKRQRREKPGPNDEVWIDYYQPTFARISEEIRTRGYDINSPHLLRASFWSLAKPGPYDPISGRALVSAYLARVDTEMERVISGQSIAYWLHVYRRIAPYSVGENDSPETVFLVRKSLEAAVSKYGRSDLCDRIGFSNEVRIESVLRGAFTEERFEPVRRRLQQQPQLVLTDFGVVQMEEFYDLEKLAYECWKCGATLRILGKGAGLNVVHEHPYFVDTRTEWLDRLVTIYDKRSLEFTVTATGTAFSSAAAKDDRTGSIVLASYNVRHLSFGNNESFLKQVGIDLGNPDESSNFVFDCFNIKSYFEAHEPFSEPFLTTHGVSLRDVILVIVALSLAILGRWSADKNEVFRYWQRAYDGPLPTRRLEEGILALLPASGDLLGVQDDLSSVRIGDAIRFLSLATRREQIDVSLGDPHSVFLPCGSESVLIDYAWIGNILYNLFFGVQLAEQHFKGPILESLVHQGKSVLPTAPCNSLSGQSRQIDAAFEQNELLVITECRAVGRSFAIERGDPVALAFRRQKIDKALHDIDEKANWLASHPIGHNYDIRKYRHILPLAITPFIEFIDSLDSTYWLSSELPRVLSPGELHQVLQNGSLVRLAGSSPNTVSVLDKDV
jgi:hypothetical protein